MNIFASAIASPSNLAVDTDAQRRPLPSVAPVGRRSPLRYTTAVERCGHQAPGMSCFGKVASREVLRRVAVIAGGKFKAAPSLGAVASAARFRLSSALLKIEGRRFEGPRSALSGSAVASSQKKAFGFCAVGLRLPEMPCAHGGRRFGRCRLAPSGHAASRAGAQGGVHNNSFDADAQVLPCASRTRLPVAGQLQR
jgi:hypothetical protein